MTGICGMSAGGIGSATRWALYPGINATRQSGRQSASLATAMCFGCLVPASRVSVSRNPRAALISLPSGDRDRLGDAVEGAEDEAGPVDEEPVAGHRIGYRHPFMSAAIVASAASLLRAHLRRLHV